MKYIKRIAYQNSAGADLWFRFDFPFHPLISRTIVETWKKKRLFEASGIRDKTNECFLDPNKTEILMTSQNTSNPGETVYEFSCGGAVGDREKLEHKIYLANSYICLHTRNPEASGKTLPVLLKNMIADLIGAYPPACFTKIGYHRIYMLHRMYAALREKQWKDLLESRALADALDTEGRVPPDEFHHFYQYHLNGPDLWITEDYFYQGATEIACGDIYKKDMKDILESRNKDVLALNFDCYQEKQIAVGDCMKSAQALYNEATRLYFSKIKEPMHEAMGPVPY